MRRGFTLIEIAACLLIMGLLVAVAAVSLLGRRQIALRSDVVARISFWDRLAREHARDFNQGGELVFDLKRQRIDAVHEASPPSSAANMGWATPTADTPIGSSRSAGWSLPAGYRITAAQVQGGRIMNHRLTIDYSPHGWSPTYALKIEGPLDGDDGDGGEGGGGGDGGGGGSGGGRWIVVAGLSGQVTGKLSTRRVQSIFAALKPANGFGNVQLLP